VYARRHSRRRRRRHRRRHRNDHCLLLYNIIIECVRPPIGNKYNN